LTLLLEDDFHSNPRPGQISLAPVRDGPAIDALVGGAPTSRQIIVIMIPVWHVVVTVAVLIILVDVIIVVLIVIVIVIIIVVLGVIIVDIVIIMTSNITMTSTGRP
jgi:hypothetical protein